MPRRSAIIDRIIVGEDGTLPLWRGAIDAVRAQSAGQAWRERTWFAGNGLDPDVRELPRTSEIVAEERSRRGKAGLSPRSGRLPSHRY